MVYYPNTKRVLDAWMFTAGELFDDVIVHNQIHITSMPPVQQSTLFASIEEESLSYVNKMKRGTIRAALTELNDAVEMYMIPNVIELESNTKENPIAWNALQLLQKVPNQPEFLFNEQQIAIKACTDAINNYGDVLHTTFIKYVTIRGYAGYIK